MAEYGSPGQFGEPVSRRSLLGMARCPQILQGRGEQPRLIERNPLIFQEKQPTARFLHDIMAPTKPMSAGGNRFVLVPATLERRP